MAGRKWTEEELELVRSGAMDVPGRTRKSVLHKRQQLGTVRPVFSSGKAWTKEEDDLLRSGIRQLDGRTEQALRSRVFKLGLRWAKYAGEWSEEEDNFLRENRFEMSNKEMAAALGRKIGAVRNRVMKIGAVGGRTQADWAPRGERSHMWRGGSEAHRRSGFYGREWQNIIRPQVYARDDWMCVVCGTGTNLRCHHVDPYRETRDHSIDNQVTLCAKHHGWAEASLDRSIMKEALRTRDFSEIRNLADACSKFKPVKTLNGKKTMSLGGERKCDRG